MINFTQEKWNLILDLKDELARLQIMNNKLQQRSNTQQKRIDELETTVKNLENRVNNSNMFGDIFKTP